MRDYRKQKALKSAHEVSLEVTQGLTKSIICVSLASFLAALTGVALVVALAQWGG